MGKGKREGGRSLLRRDGRERMGALREKGDRGAEEEEETEGS